MYLLMRQMIKCEWLKFQTSVDREKNLSKGDIQIANSEKRKSGSRVTWGQRLVRKTERIFSRKRNEIEATL